MFAFTVLRHLLMALKSMVWLHEVCFQFVCAETYARELLMQCKTLPQRSWTVGAAPPVMAVLSSVLYDTLPMRLSYSRTQDHSLRRLTGHRLSLIRVSQRYCSIRARLNECLANTNPSADPDCSVTNVG